MPLLDAILLVVLAFATPCTFDEDLSGQSSHAPCYWDAAERGNQQGQSFYTDGFTYFDLM